MTYRERKLAKAERLREWADKRRAKAAPILARSDHFRGDHAFNTQPGHIPERARLIAAEDRAFGHIDKAASMERHADDIEAAADRAIYSDDADAVERLQEKIAALKQRRETMKAANAVYRKAHRTELAALPGAYHRDQAMPHWAYELQNLSGNIGRSRDRLKRLQSEHEHGPALRGLYVKWAGTCVGCGASIEAGAFAYYRKPDLFCLMDCAKPQEAPE